MKYVYQYTCNFHNTVYYLPYPDLSHLKIVLLDPQPDSDPNPTVCFAENSAKLLTIMICTIKSFVFLSDFCLYADCYYKLSGTFLAVSSVAEPVLFSQLAR